MFNFINNFFSSSAAGHSQQRYLIMNPKVQRCTCYRILAFGFMIFDFGFLILDFYPGHGVGLLD